MEKNRTENGWQTSPTQNLCGWAALVKNDQIKARLGASGAVTSDHKGGIYKCKIEIEMEKQ